MTYRYEITKNVITSQRFELNDMLYKLDTFWTMSELTKEEYTELVQLAREKADPAASLNLQKRLEDIETRLRVLEASGANPGTGPAEEWPAWQVHKVYKTGDKVTFTDGKRYICNLPEHTTETTWSPADYPGYWLAE